MRGPLGTGKQQAAALEQFRPQRSAGGRPPKPVSGMLWLRAPLVAFGRNGPDRSGKRAMHINGARWSSEARRRAAPPVSDSQCGLAARSSGRLTEPSALRTDSCALALSHSDRAAGVRPGERAVRY